MRPNSLAFRLFVTAAAWALVALPITAFVLVAVYRGAVERNFDARLNVYLTGLLANATSQGLGTDTDPPSLVDPLFTLPFSGWYWQITPLGNDPRPVLISDSLLDQRIPLPSRKGVTADTNLVRHAYVDGPEQQHLRVLEREIALNRNGQDEGRYSFAVAGDGAEIDRTVGEFRTLVIIALSIVGAGLLIATFFQVRFGLKPLRAISHGLAAIRSGKAETLEGELPAEIKPMQAELNALIRSNHAIVERARTHVGNLAHALKTPLSVITNEAGGKRTTFARKVTEQADLMRDQITHHLNRARMAARSGVIGGATPVKPVVEALVRALQKIYETRGLSVQLTCPDDVVFHGEKHDLEEMVGNLLDNACKWARSDVSVTVEQAADSVVIMVDDDGPGLPKQARAAAIKRGQRLDETKPGSGLGLSIVAELVHLYDGEFSLNASGSGGLQARLELPNSRLDK
ncbi:MAG: ATP-binding protein [Hyphomicrobiaceae bacterium]|nr:ATP-binding protein [Hyphomicrobiaceae bacterium]